MTEGEAMWRTFGVGAKKRWLVNFCNIFAEEKSSRERNFFPTTVLALFPDPIASHTNTQGNHRR